jgi:hypothetical protein
VLVDAGDGELRFLAGEGEPAAAQPSVL